MVNLYRNSSVWDRNERIRQNDNWEKVEDWINGNMDGDVFQEWFNQNAPSIEGAWDNTKEYEGLSIVTYQGNSYTSKKRVPVGIDVNNEEYWAVTGNYDAQVEYYRRDVEQVKQDMTDVENRLTVDTNNWQKHKLTNDDGTSPVYTGFDFNTEVETVGSEFFYVTSSVNHPPNVSYNGFVQVFKGRADYQILVLYTPYNSERMFMRLKYHTWGEWSEVGGNRNTGFKGVLLTKTTAQTIPHRTFVPVVWQDTLYDTDGFFEGGNGSKIIIPEGVDKVRLTANTRWQTGGTGYRNISIRKNGQYAPGLGYANLEAINASADSVQSAVVPVQAGDYLEMYVSHSNGEDFNLNADDATFFAMEVVETSKKS